MGDKYDNSSKSLAEEYSDRIKDLQKSKQETNYIPKDWIGIVGKFENRIESILEDDYGDEDNSKKYNYVRNICLHMVHVACMLFWKCESLQSGIDALRDLKFTTSPEGWFHHCLRLRDGLHLLHSGECRHVGDIRQAKSSQFQSKLHQAGKREDGYTQLYDRSKVYSGYGWDEYYNEAIGLRTRLCRLFRGKRKRLQKQLSSSIEMLLDQVEPKMHSCRQELNTVVQSGKYQKINIQLVLTDKLEQMTYTTSNGHKITLQRPVNFTIQNDYRHFLGALPSHWDKTKWMKSFQTITSSTNPKPQTNKTNDALTKKTRRRIIIESDEEEDNDNDEDEVMDDVTSKKNAPVDKHCGFKVRNTSSQSSNGNNDQSLSINEIKHKLGVDADQLEYSRTALEKENLLQQKQQQQEHLSVHNLDEESRQEIYEIREAILQEKQQMKMYRQVLKNAIETSNDNEIWDTRESLRESYMTIGNHILNLSYIHDESNAKQSLCQKALEYFENSIPLVQELERMNNSKKALVQHEGTYIDRRCALWLCRGRAHVNAGRTKSELYPHHSRQINGKSTTISEHFNQAFDCAQKIIQHPSPKNSWNQQQCLEARELLSMTNRWKGYYLWKISKFDQAITALKSASCMDATDVIFSTSSNLQSEAYILYLIECYCSTSFLLNKISMHLYNNEMNEDKQYERWFQVAIQGYDHGMQILNRLKALTVESTYQDLVQEYGLDDVSLLKENKTALIQYWNQKKVMFRRPKQHIPLKSSEKRQNSYSREPFQTGYRPLKSDKKRTGEIVVVDSYGKVLHRTSQQNEPNADTANKSKKDKHKKNDDFFDNFGLHTGMDDNISFEDNQWDTKFETGIKHYRPWGDELIDNPNSYPSCAPPMPEEMKQDMKIN